MKTANEILLEKRTVTPPEKSKRSLVENEKALDAALRQMGLFKFVDVEMLDDTPGETTFSVELSGAMWDVIKAFEKAYPGAKVVATKSSDYNSGKPNRPTFTFEVEVR